MADFHAMSDEQPVPAAGEAVSNLDTPSILCDLDRLERNIADWQALMDRNEVRFRPHIKTHKIPDIARMQVEAGARRHHLRQAERGGAVRRRRHRRRLHRLPRARPAEVAPHRRHGRRQREDDRQLRSNETAARQASAAATAADATVNLQIDVDPGCTAAASR